MPSFAADALIEKAEEAYSLGLITLKRLEYVTERALREPGYNAIIDLPLNFEIEAARELASAAEKAASKQAARRRLLRRIFV